MDTSRDLFDSATAALRDGIRRRRVEVVLYRHDKEGAVAPDASGEDGSKEKLTKTGLRRVFAKAEGVFAARIKEAAAPMIYETEIDARDRARRTLWRQARLGGYSPASQGTWLPYPPDYKHYVHCRTFWLTRRPTDTVEDGMDLLMNASMHSVDSAHWSMRSRISAMGRRASTAKGKGLGASYYRFDVMSAELWIFLVQFNYCLFIRDERTVPRAVPMGLAGKRDRKVRPHNVAWNFRLGVQHANEISRWLTQA